MRIDSQSTRIALVAAVTILTSFSVMAQADRLAAARSELGTDSFWAVYSLERPQPQISICCSDWNGIGRTCRLDSENYGWNADSHRDGGALRIFVRVDDGEVSHLAAFSESCEVEVPPGRTVSWGAVSPAESLSWLKSWLEGGGLNRQGSDRVLMAIAHHPGDAATALLQGWARDGEDGRRRRDNAIFWLGESRGVAGLKALSRLLDSDLDSKGREQVAFALSLSHAPGATDRLVRMARYEERGSVREQALFWMGQIAGARMAEGLMEAVQDDPELQVKKQAVFGLSQLPESEGLPLLMRIVEKHPHPQVRKEALFWIGQSGSDDALDYLETLLKRL